MRAVNGLFPIMAVVSTACSSMEWRPRPTEEVWQGRSLWCAEQVTVAAVDGDTAEEGVAAWERIRAAFLAIGEAPPPAPLFVVLGPEEQLLATDPSQAMKTIRDWHLQIVADTATPGGPSGASPDASPELLAGMVRIVPAAFPLAAPELGMPQAWQRLGGWGMVVPADAAIVAVTDQMLDEGMKKQDIGFGKRLLLAPFMPWIRGAIRDKFREMIVRQLVDAGCSPRVLGRPCPPTTKSAVLERLGLPPTMQPMQAPPGMPQDVDGVPRR
ncbi:MAG: hypothetical protein JNK15_04555 [Planctomycetes bacterium]|nr:hypothetical protein [Planctomycetota bacterium]